MEEIDGLSQIDSITNIGNQSKMKTKTKNY